MSKADPRARRQQFCAQDFIDEDIKVFCHTEVKVAEDLEQYER